MFKRFRKEKKEGPQYFTKKWFFILSFGIVASFVFTDENTSMMFIALSIAVGSFVGTIVDMIGRSKFESEILANANETFTGETEEVNQFEDIYGIFEDDDDEEDEVTQIEE